MGAEAPYLGAMGASGASGVGSCLSLGSASFDSGPLAAGSFTGGGYGTGMSLLAVALNYRFLPIYER